MASSETIVIDESDATEQQPINESHLEEDEGEAMTLEQAEEDWNHLTVQQLKQELVERGLSTTGKKADLVARLLAHEFDLDEHDATEDAEAGHEVEEADNEDEEQEEEQEGGEMDEENGEGVEFVEWNEGADDDHDLPEGGECRGHELDESHDDDEHKENEGAEEALKGEVGVEEGDVKVPDVEFSVQVSEEKDLFYLNWYGKTITVPYKSEITKDMNSISKLQSVVIYPVELSDIYSEVFRGYMEKATGSKLELDEMKTGKPTKGMLKLKFGSVKEALEAIEGLKNFRDGITVKHFCLGDSENVILTQIRREECDRKGPTINRLLYVGNLPSEATEASIRQSFPDALQVNIPYDEETMERIGYAYVEYPTEDDAYEAGEKYKDLELDGQKLYVIRAIAEKKEKYGLLRDSLRLYWVDQVQKYNKFIDRSHVGRHWEVAETRKKLYVLKRRLEKDEKRREELHLPLPEPSPALNEKKKDEKPSSEAREKEKGDRSERKPSRERRRSSHHSLKDSDRKSSLHRLPSRRSPLPRRDNYRPNRGGRGGYTARNEETNKLVNQLKGLVSVLANKLPDASTAHSAPHHQTLTGRHYQADEGRYGGGRGAQGRGNYARTGYYVDHRQTPGSSYQSTTSYAGTSYDQSYPSYRGGYRENVTDRYSVKRYDNSIYSPDRKKRSSAAIGGGYMDQSSSSRYASSRVHPYSMNSRRGGAAGGRHYAVRSKPRGGYNY